MFGENKNLKDSNTNLDVSVTDISFSISYTKTHKLITALYMVTDIIDKEEPIRAKLRNLGAEIISDMHSVPKEAGAKIAETVSFLNIASAMNFISEMNCNILKKEFFELKASIQEYADMKPTWLADFFEHSPLEGWPKAGVDIPPPPKGYSSRGELNSKGHPIGHDSYKGHQNSTRIGVQKGSTLMKALSDKIDSRTITNIYNTASQAQDFELLKKERRYDIVNIIKTTTSGTTIKDIKDKIKISPEQVGSLVSCSEKTLQRELISMVRDGVLNKVGEKRWSRYFIKN